MDTLLHYMTAFGLATGAGSKATIPIIALGLFHHTPYFELSPQWAWIASPPVLTVLSAMLLIEMYVDAHPELGSWSDTLGYLPAVVAGFISFAASTGKVDSGLAQLAGSGLLGSGTAVASRAIRNMIRKPFRDHVESLHHRVGTVATAGEAGVAGVLSAAAVLLPLVGAIAAVVAILVGLSVGASVQRAGSTPCPHCGQPVDRRALVCASCRKDIAVATS